MRDIEKEIKDTYNEWYEEVCKVLDKYKDYKPNGFDGDCSAALYPVNKKYSAKLKELEKIKGETDGRETDA